MVIFFVIFPFVFNLSHCSSRISHASSTLNRFYGDCVGISKEVGEQLEDYLCPLCGEPESQTTNGTLTTFSFVLPFLFPSPCPFSPAFLSGNRFFRWSRYTVGKKVSSWLVASRESSFDPPSLKAGEHHEKKKTTLPSR